MPSQAEFIRRDKDCIGLLAPPSLMALTPRKDVQSQDGGLIALSNEPWLAFAQPCLFSQGSFLQLCYAAHTSDTPSRPLLRYWFPDGSYRDVILPAPTEGLGVWVGKSPRDISDVWISPTCRAGPFHFRIVDIRLATINEILRRAIRRPKRSFFAFSASLVGLEAEADLNWRAALGSEPQCFYGRWRSKRHMPETCHSPHNFAATQAAAFTLFIDVKDATALQCQKTFQSVLSQSVAPRRVAFVGAPQDGAALQFLSDWKGEIRLSLADEPEAIKRDDLIVRLRAGDQLDARALECFATHLERHPHHQLVYADEIQIDTGARLRRLWRPGWSPVLHRSVNYLGRAACFRGRLLDGRTDWINQTPEELVASLVLSADHETIGSIARPLFLLPAEADKPPRAFDAIYCAAAPRVSVVIPTRDRADLLRDCLDSLFTTTAYQNYEVILVDNNSVEPRTHELIARAQEKHTQLKVIRIEGGFNFSALCNAAVAAASGDFLLFLNNDTRVITPDWIERLLYFAAEPDIGAVGAKLLYPDHRTQHVGIVLGMGGVAGHFGANLPEQALGWMARNLVPHEVSAVMGACLMVERRKFEAVGGFDAVNLPVDLNDVDLCLRLAERGWRTICHSSVVLIHHESASRGGGLRLQRVYEKERRFFLERWRAAIRNDPYFNPGLSLYANEEALP